VVIDSLERCRLEELTEDDARRAGQGTLAALRRALVPHPEGDVYRIALRWVGADPRIALRAERLGSAEDRAAVQAALTKLDALGVRGARGAWTERLLALIAAQPARARPSSELCSAGRSRASSSTCGS
jgi:hypothetical protein